MIIKGKRDAVYDGVYGGFAAADSASRSAPPPPPRAAPPWPPAPARPRRRVSLALVGALAASALGLAFGWMGRPDLGGGQAAVPPMTPVPAAAPARTAPSAADLTPAPEPTVQPAPVKAARAPLEARVVPPMPPPPPLPKVERAAAPPPLPKVERAAAPPPAARRPTRVTATAPAVRPAFHCDWALRLSERMVCNDPELAALDNRLNRAFSAAVRAGVPRPMLRAEQDRWVMVNRERAAAHSRWAVEDLYRERIAELEDLADAP